MNMLNLKHFLPGKKTRMSLVALVFGIVTIVSMLGATQVFAASGTATAASNTIVSFVNKNTGDVVIVQANNINNTTLINKLKADSNWVQVSWNITGATGPQGPVGPTGPQGPQGPKGDTGANRC